VPYQEEDHVRLRSRFRAGPKILEKQKKKKQNLENLRNIYKVFSYEEGISFILQISNISDNTDPLCGNIAQNYPVHAWPSSSAYFNLFISASNILTNICTSAEYRLFLK